MIKKVLSYFIPIKIHTVNSAISKSIEVIWSKGELVMDSENANYSYGSLQRILKLGLKTIGFDKIVTMDHVLVLGVAGGSVIKTLVHEIKYKGKMTGVEIDPDIIKIANQYFKLDKIEQLKIIIDDAFEFVLKTKEKYDLIIIDVFQDTTMPNFLFEAFFTDQICFLLKSKGVVLFNTMLLNENHNKRNAQYIKGFNDTDYVVKSIPRVERHNELIVIEKKH
jgi:spermidine synthase